MRNALFAALLLLPVSGAYAACDSAQMEQAKKVRSMLDQMSAWTMAGDILVVAWGADIDAVPIEQRKRLMVAFADTDACIHGSPRRIEFFRGENRIGFASPESGVNLVQQ